MKTNIAIFCSGSGSNAQKIMEYFENHNSIRVSILMANRPDAFALERAKKMQIDTAIFNRHEFYETNHVIEQLKNKDVDWIILAGFLWLIPEKLVNAFPDKIINIHPALLPNYGGKGMYGINVHKAVVANHEKISGMTIHFVNKNYDEGNIIFQAQCDIAETDSPEEVAHKVLQLEHLHYSKIIEKTILKQ